MPIPEVRTTIANGTPAILPDDIATTCAVIGYSSSGVLTTKVFSKRSLAIAEFVEGPLVRGGAHCIDEAERAIIFQRCEASNPGEYDTIDNSEFTGTVVPAVVASLVPRNECELYVEIIESGVPGTTGITYKKSTENGRIALSGLLRLGTATRITFGDTNCGIELDPPAAQVAALIALATELLADRPLHYADAVAHNSADATAAALITLGVPTTGVEAIAVINQIRLGDISHYGNQVAHDSRDLANAITLPAATTLQGALALSIMLKAKANAHNAATYPAAAASLLALTASSVAVQVYGAADLIALGVTQLNNYPSYITFTTDAAGTPADAPPDATITGTNADTGLADTDVVTVSQIAGIATAAKRFLATGITITYGVGDGPGAMISIGTSAAAHNSADVSNDITATDPTPGTVIAGDIIRCQTFAPSPSTTELAAAFNTLALSAYTPGFVLLPGRTPASYTATITAGLDVMKENGKPVRCMAQARKSETGETIGDFRSAIETETIAVEDTRIHWVSTDTLCTISEGSGLIVPSERFTGFAINLAAYRIVLPFWETTWQVAKGKLPGVRLVDNDGVVVGWDEPKQIDTRLQLLYQVPNALLGRPTVAAPDYTLAGTDERLKTMQAGLVEDEIIRVVEAYHWEQVGITQKIRVTSPGVGVFNDETLRQSLQRSAAARLQARGGLQASVTDLDAADLVFLNPQVAIVQGVIHLEFVVKWTPAYPVGRVTTTIAVRVGA
jgi:hypothetical protein